MSDATVKARTGRDWGEWVEALDAIGADRMTHREIAGRLHADFGVGDWWAQSVTVGYERIRGLRQVGQRRDGTYETHKSKTFGVSIEDLFAAFASERARRRWLGAEPAIRKATEGKSIRMTWPDGTPVEALFTAKGPAKSQVAIQHRKLPGRTEADERKAWWSAALARLGDVLGET